MPRGSKPGERRGGREKGARNKPTENLRELVKQDLPEFNAVVFLAKVADGYPVGYRNEKGKLLNYKQSVELLLKHELAKQGKLDLTDDMPVPIPVHATIDERIKAAKEAAAYLFPKLKQVDVTSEGGEANFVTLVIKEVVEEGKEEVARDNADEAAE